MIFFYLRIISLLFVMGITSSVIGMDVQSSPRTGTSRRTIIVENQITPKHLEVHHFGTHLPDTFSLSIYEEAGSQRELFSYAHKNNVPVNKSSQPVEVRLDSNNYIIFDYSYSFAFGIYKATKRARFKVPEGVQAINVSFSFREDQRVLIPEAQFLAPIESVT